MSLRSLQLLLFGAAIAWGLFPQWGGLFFGACYGLLLLTIVSKRRAAQKKLSAHTEQMAGSLTPEAIEWAKKHPLFYVWPSAAREWALTMKVVSLMMLLLSIWFVVRGLVFLQPWVWLCILPAAVIFFLGVTWGDKLDLENVLAEEKWKAQKPLHDEVKKVLTLQSLAGKWAPGEPV